MTPMVLSQPIQALPIYMILRPTKLITQDAKYPKNRYAILRTLRPFYGVYPEHCRRKKKVSAANDLDLGSADRGDETKLIIR
jgi:hypothetical protein